MTANTPVVLVDERAMRVTIRTYTRDRVARGELSESSVPVIEAVLRRWLRHVDDLPPDEWTRELVATWVHDPSVRPATRKSRLTKLRPFVRWMIERDMMSHDPTIGVARVRVPIGRPRDLTVDEVRRLYTAAPDQRARLIILAMAHLGLRCGDLARVRVEDLDSRRRRTLVRGKGGRGEPTHEVHIPTELWDAITAWLRATGLRSGPLLRSYQDPASGLTPAHVGRIITRLLWETGVKQFPGDGISPHSLRHTCAQTLVDAGAELRIVQHVLGHRDQRTTEIYVRRDPVGVVEQLEARAFAA